MAGLVSVAPRGALGCARVEQPVGRVFPDHHPGLPARGEPTAYPAAIDLTSVLSCSSRANTQVDTGTRQPERVRLCGHATRAAPEIRDWARAVGAHEFTERGKKRAIRRLGCESILSPLGEAPCVWPGSARIGARHPGRQCDGRRSRPRHPRSRRRPRRRLLGRTGHRRRLPRQPTTTIRRNAWPPDLAQLGHGFDRGSGLAWPTDHWPSPPGFRVNERPGCDPLASGVPSSCALRAGG